MDDERLVVALEARVADFEKRMSRAERRGSDTYRRLQRGSFGATRSMERDMVRSTGRINQALAMTSTRVGTFSKAMVAGLAGGAITAALAGITSGLGQTIKGIAAVGDEAKRAGVSLEAFQEWKYVAEQNRIGVDAMVDGLKELNLRADEFIASGSGPAAEAFQRLGFGASELGDALKNPSELMLDIIARMEELDTAAQIRVADEVFGGTAGERFVEMVSLGSAKLRETAQRAHEVGAVMDEEMIAKAAELDRKFADLQTRIGSFFKSVSVGAAEAIEKIVTLRSDIEGMVNNIEQAEGLLGKDVVKELQETTGAADEHAEAIRTIIGQYEQLATRGAGMAAQLEATAGQLYAFGEADAAQALAEVAQGMRDLQAEMQDGKVDAEEFEDRMLGLTEKANDAFDALSDIDRAEFSNVVAGIGGLSAALNGAIAVARRLRASLPGGADLSSGPVTPATEDGHFWDNPANEDFFNPATGNAPTTSVRPQSPPPLVDENVIAPSRSGGGGGGGGSRRDNSNPALERLMESLQTEREILEEWYAESLDLLNSATDEQLTALGGRYEAKERLEREHQDRMLGIQDQGNDYSVQSILKGGAQILGALGTVNKKALKISQVFAAAEAWISTLKGAAKELEKGTLGFGTAAAVISKGLAFVSAIRGVNAETGNGSGGGIGGGGAAGISTAREQAPLQTFAFTVQNDPLGLSENLIRKIAEQMNEASRNGMSIRATVNT